MIEGMVTVTDTPAPLTSIRIPCWRVALRGVAGVARIGGPGGQLYVLPVDGEIELFVRDAADIYCVSDGVAVVAYVISADISYEQAEDAGFAGTSMETQMLSTVQSLAPLLWYRMNEPSGTTAVNSGTLGTGLNGVISGSVTVGQTGLLGPVQAYDFAQNSNAIVTIPNNAAWANAASYTCAQLVTVDTTLATGSRLYAASRIDCYIATSTLVTSQLFSSTNALSSATLSITPGAWFWLFVTFSASDNTLRMYRGLDTIAEVSYAGQTAGVGVKDNPAVSLTLGNNSGGARSMDGLYDEFMYFDRALTLGEMNTIAALS